MFERCICVQNTFTFWGSQSWLWTTVSETWCVWVSFWDEILQFVDRTIFFRIWNPIHSFFSFGASVLSIPLCQFYFVLFYRKCGVRVSIIICVDFSTAHGISIPGEQSDRFNKPHSNAQYDRIVVSKQVCWILFQITFRNYFFVLNWFCQPLFQLFLQFAIKDCIAPF